jgi:hypothetical protein
VHGKDGAAIVDLPKRNSECSPHIFISRCFAGFSGGLRLQLQLLDSVN